MTEEIPCVDKCDAADDRPSDEVTGRNSVQLAVVCQAALRTASDRERVTSLLTHAMNDGLRCFTRESTDRVNQEW